MTCSPIVPRDRPAVALGRGIATTLMLAAMLHGAPAAAEQDCPTTPAELSFALDNEDAAARALAAECFVEEAVFFDFEELKHIVNVMLRDDAADVRYNGLATLYASAWAGLTTGSDLRNEKAKIIQILNEDPVARNKAGAVGIISMMDPIPVNQVEQPLLDLLSHSESKVVDIALETLLRFPEPPEEEISQSLLAMTGHGSAHHRRVANKGLGLLHRRNPNVDGVVIDLLAGALSDESRHVQWQAANSLRMIGPPAITAEPELQAVVWDPLQPPEVRKIAKEAVETITGAPIKPPWLVEPPPPAPPGVAGAPQ